MNAPATTPDSRFSDPRAPGTSWERTEEVLTSAELFWISSVRRDRRPHVTPLVAVWSGEALCFCTGEEEQKTVNLAGNARVALSTGCNEWTGGLDVVLEGDAIPVIDSATLRYLAELWTQKWDGPWRYRVGQGAFTIPEAQTARSCSR